MSFITSLKTFWKVARSKLTGGCMYYIHYGSGFVQLRDGEAFYSHPAIKLTAKEVGEVYRQLFNMRNELTLEKEE